MSWGLTIVIAILTAIAGAGAAGFLATLCIDWYRISPREGGSGYFVLFIGLTGFVGGFLIGAITSRVVSSGFWMAQAYSLGIVAGICLVIGLLARFYGEVPPTLDGERLRLEVELKCPRGWRPAKDPSSSLCTLQSVGPGRTRMDDPIYGQVNWTKATQVDGQWVAPCAVDLFTSRTNRYVHVTLVSRVDVTFFLPLPGNPKPEHQQWSNWTNEGFSHVENQSAVTDFAFRYRVKRDSVWHEEDDAAYAAARQAVENSIAAIPANASIELWLPFFEQSDTGKPAMDLQQGVEARAREVIKARATELKAPLESADPQLVRRAVFAAATLSEVPPELIGPLQKAGRLTLDLIKEARADDVIARPALEYFFKWDLAMDLAGPAARQPHLTVIREIEHELGPASGGDLGTLASYARQGIEKLTQ